MRISDWSSDVCSSDLRRLGAGSPGGGGRGRVPRALRGEGGERERRRRKRRLQAPQGTDGQGGHRLTGPRRTASATPPPPRPQTFFMAVYTEVSAEDIESFVAEYGLRSAEHTSELQSLLRIPYAVFFLKQKTTIQPNPQK